MKEILVIVSNHGIGKKNFSFSSRKLKKGFGHALPVEPLVGAPKPPLVQPVGKTICCCCSLENLVPTNFEAAILVSREEWNGVEAGKLEAGALERESWV